MKEVKMLKELKCINENIDLDDYLSLYKYVRDNMEHPEWLGTFTKEEIINILNNKGKIWIYYDNEKIVCSMFYIPIKEKTLLKHNIYLKEKDVGSLGPIMVSPDYIGLEEYMKNINKKYIFTKVCSDNIYSLNNMKKNNYQVVDTYIDERGENKALIKEINRNYR